MILKTAARESSILASTPFIVDMLGTKLQTSFICHGFSCCPCYQVSVIVRCPSYL